MQEIVYLFSNTFIFFNYIFTSNSKDLLILPELSWWLLSGFHPQLFTSEPILDLFVSFLHNESYNLLCWLHKHCISIFCITSCWIPIGRMAVGHSKIVQQVCKLRKCYTSLKRTEFIFRVQNSS